MASNYGQNILQSMGNYRQEQLLRQERDRANQPNLLAGLAGLLSGAVSAGRVSPDKGWGNLGAILSSPEAWGGAMTGVMQPTANTAKDLFTGGLAGIQSARDIKELEREQAKWEREQAKWEQEQADKKYETSAKVAGMVKDIGLTYQPKGRVSADLEGLGEMTFDIKPEDGITEKERRTLHLSERRLNLDIEKFNKLYSLGDTKTETAVINQINSMINRRDTLIKTLETSEFDEEGTTQESLNNELQWYNTAISKLQNDYSTTKGLVIPRVDKKEKGKSFWEKWKEIIQLGNVALPRYNFPQKQGVAPSPRPVQATLDELYPKLSKVIKTRVDNARKAGLSDEQIMQSDDLKGLY